jgi:hypothetical protein
LIIDALIPVNNEADTTRIKSRLYHAVEARGDYSKLSLSILPAIKELRDGLHVILVSSIGLGSWQKLLLCGVFCSWSKIFEKADG